MSKKVGLWIDHRKAVVIFVTSQDEADDIELWVLTEHLNTYYGQVISYLQAAESVFLFGSGEAKGELEKRPAKDHPGSRVLTVETVDKITDSQIVENVKKHFLHHGQCESYRIERRAKIINLDKNWSAELRGFKSVSLELLHKSEKSSKTTSLSLSVLTKPHLCKNLPVCSVFKNSILNPTIPQLH